MAGEAQEACANCSTYRASGTCRSSQEDMGADRKVSWPLRNDVELITRPVDKPKPTPPPAAPVASKAVEPPVQETTSDEPVAQEASVPDEILEEAAAPEVEGFGDAPAPSEVDTAAATIAAESEVPQTNGHAEELLPEEPVAEDDFEDPAIASSGAKPYEPEASSAPLAPEPVTTYTGPPGFNAISKAQQAVLTPAPRTNSRAAMRHKTADGQGVVLPASIGGVSSLEMQFGSLQFGGLNGDGVEAPPAPETLQSPPQPTITSPIRAPQPISQPSQPAAPAPVPAQPAVVAPSTSYYSQQAQPAVPQPQAQAQTQQQGYLAPHQTLQQQMSQSYQQQYLQQHQQPQAQAQPAQTHTSPSAQPQEQPHQQQPYGYRGQHDYYGSLSQPEQHQQSTPQQQTQQPQPQQQQEQYGGFGGFGQSHLFGQPQGQQQQSHANDYGQRVSRLGECDERS